MHIISNIYFLDGGLGGLGSYYFLTFSFFSTMRAAYSLTIPPLIQ